jgi:outer membrane protein OmpA-like peptidoglycan-associated protein
LQDSPQPAPPQKTRLVPTSKVEPTTRPQAALEPPPAPGAAMNAPQGGAVADEAQAANRNAPGDGATAVVGDSLRVVFQTGMTEVPREAIPALEQLAAALAQDSERRVQLRAYAGAKGENASQSRRVALFRALSVRSYLIQRGVRSTRMDIRALGNKYEEEPADRVDILPVTP